MTFLNSVNLLNMGAEPVKAAQNNPSNQDEANKPSIEFAQTLRKQLQQSLQKAPAPQSATNKTSVDTVKQNTRSRENDAPERQAADANAKATSAAEQPSEKTTVQNEAVKHDADSGATKEVAQQDDTQTGKTVHAESEVDETAAARKKRILSELQAQDLTESGVSPWMQTMIAMRTATATGAEKGTPSAGKSGPSAIELSESVRSDISVAVTADEAMPAAVTTGVLAQPLDIPSQRNLSPAFKDVLEGTSSEIANPVDMNGLSETVNLNRSVMDAAIETAMTGRANQDKGQPFSAEAPTMDALPVSQTTPNTPGLNAAGITPASNVVTTQIATPFGNERWQAAMNQHVMRMVGSGDEVASLTLSPPDLGPIQVVLKVDNQSVNTSFITDNPLVRQALEDGMQDLKDRMQSQGLALGQTFVGDGRQAQQHFETQDQQASAQTRRGGEPVSDTASPPASTPVRAVKLGMVDTFV